MTPPISNAPAWLVPINVLRSVVVLLAVLFFSILFDPWLRLIVLFNRRLDEDRRVLRMNRVMRWWGYAQFWSYRIGLGLRLEIKGKVPQSGRYLIISNHQSSLDIPMFFTIFSKQNIKFVAMEELRYGKPTVSYALRNGGFVTVAKKSLGKDLAAIKRFAQRLEKNEGTPVIFPEGRRTDDGYLLPFQTAGTEMIRRHACLPLLPVTLDGLWEARTIWQMYRIVGSRVTIRISDPIPFEDTEKDPRAVYVKIEETIRNDLEDMRGSASASS